MPVFNDAENREFKIIPETDAIFCVKEFSCGLSTGTKTRGSPNYDAELEIEGHGVVIPLQLIDHPSCNWKIDTFLKSANIQLRKGEKFEFQEDKAKEEGVRWINPIGLRGWCNVIIDNYIKDGKERKSNKVGTFYTNMEKLPAIVPEVSEEDVPF